MSTTPLWGVRAGLAEGWKYYCWLALIRCICVAGGPLYIDQCHCHCNHCVRWRRPPSSPLSYWDLDLCFLSFTQCSNWPHSYLHDWGICYLLSNHTDWSIPPFLTVPIASVDLNTTSTLSGYHWAKYWWTQKSCKQHSDRAKVAVKDKDPPSSVLKYFRLLQEKLDPVFIKLIY